MMQQITTSNLEVDQDTENKGRAMLYNAIRLNNVALLETLINKWQHDYSNKPDILQKIDKLLLEVYEELTLKDVPLSMEIIFFVECRLIHCSFFTEKNKTVVKTSLNDVMQRIEIVCEHIAKLKQEYSDVEEKNLDVEFFFIARFIAQNIRVLKRQLKSTYNALPWEEIEFCLVNFITVNTKYQEFNVVYKLVLDKARLLNYLTNFATKLNEKKSSIKETDINSKLPKQGIKELSQCNGSSTTSSDSVSSCGLYEDFELIKNVYSLRQIECYIKLATSINLDEKKEIGKLVIERTLQVIGESLKNTLESPHLSYDVHELLLRSAPKNVRENITSLRDLLSHSYTLNKKIELENSKDQQFFHKIQNDLKKIEVEISNILYRQKVKAIKMFLDKIIKSKDLAEMKKLASGVSRADIGEIRLDDTNTKELKRIKELIEELANNIKDQTEKEKYLFKKILDILDFQETRLADAKKSYVAGFSTINYLIDQIHHSNNCDTIKNVSHIYLNGIKSQVQNKKLQEIILLVLEISKSAELRMHNRDACDKINVQIHQILCTIAFEAGRIKGIDEFKESLEKGENDQQSKAHEEINIILADIEKSIKEEVNKKTYQKELNNKRIIYETKLTLIDFFNKKSKLITGELIDEATYINAVKMLKLNSKNEKVLESYFKSDSDAKKGKALVQQKIADSYGKLINDIDHFKTSLSVTCKRKSLETFFKSIKLANQDEIKCILNDIINKYKEKLQSNFDERLDILKQLFYSNGNNLELMQICKKDKQVQAAVEILVLDVTEILENVSLLEDNVLCFDTHTPILIGKSLRNYLAHGDALIDILPFNPLVAVVSTAIILFEEGKNLIIKEREIGQRLKENISALTKIFSWSLNILTNQRKMFSAAKEGSLIKLSYCISNGADILGRGINGMTGLHFAAQGDGVEITKFFLNQNLSIDVENMYNQQPQHIAAMFGSSKIIECFIEDNKLNINGISCETTLLHIAARHGQMGVVKVLLDKGANVEALDKDTMTPLHLAAQNGYQNVVGILLGKGVNIDAMTQDNRTALNLASQNGHLEVVEALLKKQANINGVGKDMTPLLVAAQNGHTDVVKALLANGAKIDAVSKNKWTALHFAAQTGFMSVVIALLDKDANVNALNKYKWAPLHFAARNGHTDVIKALLAKNADVNVSNVDNIKPLHWAAENGHCDAVVELMKNGANINASANTYSNWTPLHFATGNDHKEVAEALLHKEAIVDARDENYATPLHVAANNGFKDIVTLLLDNGANVDASSRDNLTPLYVAATQGHTDVVIALLNKKAGVFASDKNNTTPLHVAAENGHTAIVIALLENEAEVDASNNDYLRPLYLASKNGYLDIVQVLLRKGANADAIGRDNITPLLVAAASGHKHVVKALLESRANVSAKTLDGNNPLHMAAATGHKVVVDVLLNHVKEKEANIFNNFINASNKADVTPLHVAAQGGHKDVVVVLLENGANVNAQTMQDLTPLYLATFSGYQDIVEILLEKRAKFDIPNTLNVTPLHVAARSGNKTLVDVLIKRVTDKEPNKLNKFIDAPAKDNVTPLHMAADKGCADIAEGLLRNGASVHAVTKRSNMTPLHNAALAGHKPVVNVLLNHVQTKDRTKLNQFINAVAKENWTPLHFAAGKGHAGVVVMLLENGANVDVKDEFNKTPLHWGQQYGHKEVVDALLGKCTTEQ